MATIHTQKVNIPQPRPFIPRALASFAIATATAKAIIMPSNVVIPSIFLLHQLSFLEVTKSNRCLSADQIILLFFVSMFVKACSRDKLHLRGARVGEAGGDVVDQCS